MSENQTTENKKGVWVIVKNSVGEEVGRFEAEKGRSVEEVAIEKGIDMPLACGSGACFYCAVKVEKGMECLDQGLMMEPPLPIDEGLFLPCIGGVLDECFDDGQYHEIVVQMLNA